MTWRACGFMGGLVFAAAAGAADQDWAGDHWGTFVAHSAATTRLVTSPDFVPPGYDLAAGSFFASTSVAAVAAVGRGSVSPSANSVGLTWGRNWQVGRRVSGVELDLGRVNLGAARSGSGLYPGFGAFGFDVTQAVSTDWVATARGRIGHAFNRSLVYATAGVVLARLRVDAQFVDNSENARASTSLSKSQWGWAVGVGCEYALNGGWSAKAEVLHFDLGRASSTSNNMASEFGSYAAHTFTTRARLRANQWRLGLNKRW